MQAMQSVTVHALVAFTEGSSTTVVDLVLWILFDDFVFADFDLVAAFPCGEVSSSTTSDDECPLSQLTNLGI